MRKGRRIPAFSSFATFQSLPKAQANPSAISDSTRLFQTQTCKKSIKNLDTLQRKSLSYPLLLDLWTFKPAVFGFSRPVRRPWE